MPTTENNYLYFSKKARIGIAAVLAVVILITAYTYGIQKPKIAQVDTAKYDKAIAALQLLQEDTSAADYRPYNNSNYSGKYKPYQRKSYNNNSYKKDVPGILFSFDPNTLSVAGWQKLGVNEKTALSIQKYLSKGGKFRKAEDLKKIYGLSDEMKEALIPYANIPAQAYTNNYSNNYDNEKKTYPERPAYKRPEVKPFDINEADNSMLEAISGIGPSYAKRILNYRDKLGGFYAIEQVAEVYMMPDSIYQKVKPYLLLGESKFHNININTASKDDLANHPYIRWKMAQTIIAYRDQHGKFSKREDLRKIMSISPEEYIRLAPYVIVD